MIGLLATGALALAQGDGGANPKIVFCEMGDGCRYSPASGDFSPEDVELLFGEPDPHGKNTAVCIDSGGCQWSAVTPEDLDLSYGGDGEPMREMVFDEDEVDPVTDDDDAMIFEEDEVDPVDLGSLNIPFQDWDKLAVNVVPKPGAWTSTHLAGAMVCPGVMTLDIPASGPESGTMEVSDDGATLTAVGLDPDTASVPMQRVAPGAYHGELTVTADGQAMTVNFETVFLDDGFAIGLIHADVTAQGVECRIERRFWTIFDGEDLVPSPDDAGPDDTPDTDDGPDLVS